MQFRWLHLCDKYGNWDGPFLQMRTSVDVEWEDVPIVSMKRRIYGVGK